MYISCLISISIITTSICSFVFPCINVGITKNKVLATKIQEIYQKRGINSHTVEKYLDSEEFLQNVLQFDNLIKNTEEEEDILTIESVVLANYEEILKKE